MMLHKFLILIKLLESEYFSLDIILECLYLTKLRKNKNSNGQSINSILKTC